MLQRAQIRAVAQEIAGAADTAMIDYRLDLSLEEPDITGRMLGAISDRLRNQDIRGIRWRGRTLRTSRGVANEEGRHGADVLGVLDIQTSTLRVTKGFLAQAKRAELGTPFAIGEWHRLQAQCSTMLQLTPASFVIAYSRRSGVRFVPAVEIAGSMERDLLAHYNRGTQTFFELFIECFVGDPRLNSSDVRRLDALRASAVDQVLVVEGRTEDFVG